MRSHFFFLTTTSATDNYQQKKLRKLQTSPHKITQLKKSPLKLTKNTKAQDDKEINFKLLTDLNREYDDVDQTHYKILKAIEQMNIRDRGMFPNGTNNNGKRKPPRYDSLRNITTPSARTITTNGKEIFNDIIKKHLIDFHNDDISMVKRNNHYDLTMRTTSSWKRNKNVKRIPTTPVTDGYIDANHRQNTRQLNSRDYSRSGHVVDKLKHVLLNYDISRRPEQRRNSLQKFSLVYVPIPLKLKARYNYLNHFPVNPRMQVLLSNYGYYLPGSLGIRRFGLYNHLAYNNIHAKKLFGPIYSNSIDIEPDADPGYK